MKDILVYNLKDTKQVSIRCLIKCIQLQKSEPFIFIIKFKIIIQRIQKQVKRKMPSYIVRNGRLQIRQKDYNIPNYRIVPYVSINNPTHNDYLTNTMQELKNQILKLKHDYRNLIHTMWKIFSQIDKTVYDPQIVFMGLKTQQIYDKISFIRNLNYYEPQEQSLKLSAIMKVDDTPIYAIQKTQTSPQRSKLRESVRQDSLYQIQEEQQCQSTSSHQQNNQNLPTNQQNLIKQKPLTPISAVGQRLSLQNLTSHKRQSRNSSILLKQKLSLAFHQQQQLKQILQQELQKISKQLDEKNQCLIWAVDQLKVRNQLIQKLKQTILLRDEAMDLQQQKLLIKDKSFDGKRYQELIDEKDRQIGLIVNSLIERTQQTSEDFQFLKNSVQTSILRNTQNNRQTQTLNKSQDNKMNQSIYFDELQRSIKDQVLDKIAKSPTLSSKQPQRFHLTQSIEYSALKPKKMNFDSAENITYLTKQHFLQAQKKSQNYMLPNVKMTQSLKTQNSSKNTNQLL